jgi:hypothetical protein
MPKSRAAWDLDVLPQKVDQATERLGLRSRLSYFHDRMQVKYFDLRCGRSLLSVKVQQPCSNPTRTEPNTAETLAPSIDRNPRI